MPESSPEAWKKMVLRSMPAPAWLSTDAPESDVVISSRFRAARNLRGHRFPHRAEPPELIEIESKVREASRPSRLNPQSRITEAERDYLLGARLISPEFRHRDPGRMVLLDESRLVSVMVNEEDHLRIQAVSAGWSIRTAVRAGLQITDYLERNLEFQTDPRHGFLTASPSNLGGGVRRSALFHLAGLAQDGRLNRLVKTLHHIGITTRGLFGESSRGIASFVQISATSVSESEFVGAANHLIQEERTARREAKRDELREKASAAIDFAIASQQIALRDALLVLGYVRWGTAIGLEGFPTSVREADTWITEMEVFGTQNPRTAARHRADYLRARLESMEI